VLSVAVYNHYKRLKPPALKARMTSSWGRANILMIGPTGSGKDALAGKRLARLLTCLLPLPTLPPMTEDRLCG